MRATVEARELQTCGLAPETAERLAHQATSILQRHRPAPDRPQAQDAAWEELRDLLAAAPRGSCPFEAHLLLHQAAFEGRRTADGPPPTWRPSPSVIERTNLSAVMRERGASDYAAFHRWTTREREAFWELVIRRLRIRFQTPPRRTLDPPVDAERPRWLPGARLNIADTCFQADPARTAILYGLESEPGLARTTYGQLERLTNRVASGLDRLGLGPRDGVALYMPMTPESVAAYLGVIRSGRTVVGIADASAPPELDRRLRLGGARLVVTVDSYVRDGKPQSIYPKVVEANAPRAVVLPAPGQARPQAALRPGDLSWTDFLGPSESYPSVPRDPLDATNILFSSGTTKDPKAIPWNHTTPIKSMMDAHFHHDVHADDVLAWPTSFGWMMGPWLTYASLTHGAAMALFNGAPTQREFGRFVADAGVTLLGVVPKLVRTWRLRRTMEGLDWSRIRLFSSTAEPSDPEDMLYLMHLSGYQPIIEYCGGTEIGGGYITGTLLQPASPGTFSTPSLGLDFQILDEAGRPADRGEVGLVPPSLGLSLDLLNYDHHKEYFEGFPKGPSGESLRRHGDQLERLGRGFFRHHGRMDDVINLNGVKTSAEELRHVLRHELVLDCKPVAVDVEGRGQHRLVVYAVPRDRGQVESDPLRQRLLADFPRAIKERLNPLLAHVHDVVLVPELAQAGPGKTRTMKEFQADYQARRRLGPASPNPPRALAPG